MRLKRCYYALPMVSLFFLFASVMASAAIEKEFKAGGLRVQVNEQTGGFAVFTGETKVLENRLSLSRENTNMAAAFGPGASVEAVSPPRVGGKVAEGTWIRVKGTTSNCLFQIVRTIVLTPTTVRSTVRAIQSSEDKQQTNLREDLLLDRALFIGQSFKALAEGSKYVPGVLGDEQKGLWQNNTDDSIYLAMAAPKVGSVYFFGQGQYHGRWALAPGLPKEHSIPLSFHHYFDGKAHGDFSGCIWEIGIGGQKALPPEVQSFQFDALDLQAWNSEDMDIFSTTTERLYLHGAWKIWPIKASVGNPTNDPGTRDKVFLPNYNDSGWLRYPVPYSWNTATPPGCRPSEVVDTQDGVVWYRRNVVIPRYESNQRVFLHFDNVQTEAIVFFNGEPVGRHCNFNRKLDLADQSVEPFEFDVTRLVRPGMTNCVAVRVYLHPARRWSYRGGIVGMVYLDVRPEIYAENIRLTPNLKNSSVEVALDLVNLGTIAKAVAPEIRIEPWKSHRYDLPGGQSYAHRPEPVTLKPGQTSYHATVPLPSAILWSPDQPFLYRVSLLDPQVKTAGKRPAGLLGQARFGMRTFEVVGQEFHLNGHPIWLAGIADSTAGVGHYRSFYYYFNADRFLERSIERRKAWLGATIQRFWSPLFGCLFDLCDEKGLMAQTGATINIEHYRGMAKSNEQDQADITGIIACITAFGYNHPALVTYDLGNEYYDWGYEGGTRIGATKNLGAPLTFAYQQMKQRDPTRPVCNGSGRSAGAPIGAGANEPSLTDFFEPHAYLFDIVNFDRVDFQGFYDAYVKAFGKEAPLVNGEWHFGQLARQQGIIIKLWKEDFLLGDREGILDFYMRFDKGRWGGIAEYYVAEHTDECSETFYDRHGKMYRDKIDVMRRKPFCKGSYVHGSPPVTGAREGVPQGDGGSIGHYEGTVADHRHYLGWMKNAYAPFYACPDMFDRKLFRGGELSATLTIMNDRPRPVTDASAVARIVSTQAQVIAETVLPAGLLKEGTKKELPLKMKIPTAIADGHYRLDVLAREGTRQAASNSYDLMILGQAEVFPAVKATRRIGLYIGAGGGLFDGTPEDPVQTETMFRDFQVTFTHVKDLAQLKDVDVLVIGLNSIDSGLVQQGDALRNWIEQGGRVLCLEQNMDLNLPWSTGLRFSGLPYGMADYFQIVFPEHPAFKGLDRSYLYLPNRVLDRREYYRYFLLPLTKGLAAVGKTSGNQLYFGMLLSEHKLGKGLFLVNTIECVSTYRQDSLIRRYIGNLLAYACTEAWTGEFAAEAPAPGHRIPPPLAKDCVTVDLAPYVNHSLRDEKKGDKVGGWDDNGPKDMRHFPTGKQVLGGIPFFVIPPSTNDDRSVIVLGNETTRAYFPREVKGITLKGLKAKRLFFMVAASFCPANSVTIGTLTINYEGGLTPMPKAEVPLVVGKNIRDWASDKPELTEAMVVWRQKHPIVAAFASISVVAWDNPYARAPIQTIDITSNGKAVLILMAVTAENP